MPINFCIGSFDGYFPAILLIAAAGQFQRNFISFTLDGIPYAPVMFLYALRKKLHPTFLLLKTHATPIPAHFKQNTPQKMSGKKLP